MSRESASGRRLKVAGAERGLDEGQRLLARGEAGAALRVWSQALAAAEDPALRRELAGRLGRARRAVALRRLGPPAMLLGCLAPLLALGLSTLIRRGEEARRDEAAAALRGAREQVACGATEAALEALGGVTRRWSGTPAAGQAAALLGQLSGALARARAGAEAARGALERRAPGEAAARLEAALEELAPWPGLPLALELQRARDEARAAEALLRGKEALEEGDTARARELLAPQAERAAEARQGLLAADLAEATARGAEALEGGQPGAALEHLRRANALARRLRQPERDLAPLEATWRELRRLRALLAIDRLAEALARDDPASARAAAALPAGERPDDERLAARLDALARLAQGDLPADMVLVPGGAAPRGDVLAPDELPLALEDVAPFLIDRREVTRGQVQAWLLATGAPPPPGWSPPQDERQAQEPARGLSWHEASAWAAWAGKRLPSELEWEAAARLERAGLADARAVVARERFQAAWAASLAHVSSAAEAAWAEALATPGSGRRRAPLAAPAPPPLELPGEPRPLLRGDQVEVSPAAGLLLLEARRWPWGGFWDPERCALGGERPAPMGALGASPWGVEDLAGSVAEWTASEYRPLQGPLRSPCEGKGRRVVRGGSFRATPDGVRTAARAAVAPEVRFDDLGFRCARDLE